jgi:cellulose biosynthesis protein BcsQ
MKNLPGAFSYLIRKTAEEKGVDIVLIDLNPSLSAINQALIISSDFFILPTFPDYFSEMAINSIARVLPNWEKWAKQARELFNDVTYPLPMSSPKFLGYTVNNFTSHNGKPAIAFQRVIERIERTVRDILIPSFEKVNMLLPNEVYHNYRLAQIPNFHTFQARSQEYGVPVFELTDEMIGSKNDTLENQKRRKEKLNVLFLDATNEILRLMDYAESH